MTNAVVPPFVSLSPLQSAAADYIARKGIHAFMDEEYNLIGTRVRAVITEENVDLARGFGLPVDGIDLPVAIDKKKILDKIDGAPRDACRKQLAAFFADEANAPQLSMGQRMFLEWHYLAPNNYQHTLTKPWRGTTDRARVMGWNRETSVEDRGDFLFFTGLLGCTGLCAVAEDGAAYFSHWDEVCNPRQVDGYARFAAKHPGGLVRIIGACSLELAPAIRKQHPKLAIECHVKKIYMERTYTVAFSRVDGRVSIRINETEVTDDYVPSTHNGQYGRWFPYGRFGQAFPGTDEEFHQRDFHVFA